jgi:hypothetical protein
MPLHCGMVWKSTPTIYSKPNQPNILKQEKIFKQEKRISKQENEYSNKKKEYLNKKNE